VDEDSQILRQDIIHELCSPNSRPTECGRAAKRLFWVIDFGSIHITIMARLGL
jgi:hypothetical protein